MWQPLSLTDFNLTASSIWQPPQSDSLLNLTASSIWQPLRLTATHSDSHLSGQPAHVTPPAIYPTAQTSRWRLASFVVNMFRSDVTVSDVAVSDVTASDITHSDITHCDVTHWHHSQWRHSVISHSDITASDITGSDVTQWHHSVTLLTVTSLPVTSLSDITQWHYSQWRHSMTSLTVTSLTGSKWGNWISHTDSTWRLYNNPSYQTMVPSSHSRSFHRHHIPNIRRRVNIEMTLDRHRQNHRKCNGNWTNEIKSTKKPSNHHISQTVNCFVLAGKKYHHHHYYHYYYYYKFWA